MRYGVLIVCLWIGGFFSADVFSASLYRPFFLSAQVGMQVTRIEGGDRYGFLGMPQYASDNQSHFSTRYAAGIYLGHHFSLALAYDALHGYSTQINIKTIMGDATGTVYRKLQGYDVMLNGFIPLHRFYVRIGAGPVLLDAKYRPVSLRFDGLLFPYDLGGRYHRLFVRPKLIVGVGYKVTQHLMLSINYSRIFHVGQTLPEDITLYVPTIDTVSLAVVMISPWLI